jgi:hypothetical protein
MTVDLDVVSRFIDRFGLPVLLLVAIFWVAYAFVRGPMMTLAEKLGDAAGALCRAGVDYLSELTSSLHRTHVEHAELRHHVTVEAASTREFVAQEVRAIRGSSPSGVHDQVGAGPRSASRPTMPSCGPQGEP